MKITLQTTVNRPIDIVFDQIADARNEATWNSTLENYKLLTPEPIGKGSMFSYENRGNTFTSTLSEYDKPHHLAFQVQGKPMDIRAKVIFESVDANITTVHAEYVFMPKGMMKIMLPLFAPFLKSAFDKEFENFKKFSESQK